MSFGIFVFSDSKYINEGKISNRIFTCGFWISCFWKIRLAMHLPEKNTDNYEKTILQRHLQLFLSRDFLFWPCPTELCVFILRTGHKLVINRLNFWGVQKISSTINWPLAFGKPKPWTIKSSTLFNGCFKVKRDGPYQQEINSSKELWRGGMRFSQSEKNYDHGIWSDIDWNPPVGLSHSLML